MSEGLRLLRRARTAVPSLVTFTADETYVALAFREMSSGAERSLFGALDKCPRRRLGKFLFGANSPRGSRQVFCEARREDKTFLSRSRHLLAA